MSDERRAWEVVAQAGAKAKDVLDTLPVRRRLGERTLLRVGRRGWERPNVAVSARLFTLYRLADPWDPNQRSDAEESIRLGPVSLRLGVPKRQPAPHLKPKAPKKTAKKTNLPPGFKPPSGVSSASSGSRLPPGFKAPRGCPMPKSPGPTSRRRRLPDHPHSPGNLAGRRSTVWSERSRCGRIRRVGRSRLTGLHCGLPSPHRGPRSPHRSAHRRCLRRRRRQPGSRPASSRRVVCLMPRKPIPGLRRRHHHARPQPPEANQALENLADPGNIGWSAGFPHGLISPVMWVGVRRSPPLGRR